MIQRTMQYETASGILVTDRRYSRSSPEDGDPRSWPPNDNVDPPPPDGPGGGPNMSEGFGNSHVMYPDPSIEQQTTTPLGAPLVQAWSGWPTEWSTPNWGSTVGIPEIIGRVSSVFGAIDMNSSILSTMPPYRLQGRTVIEQLPWMNNPQPEVYNGWTEALKQVIMSYYTGEAFLWATSRYADNSVRQWVMLDRSWVSIEMIGQVRRYFMNGIDISEDCLHLRYASWPGYPHGFGPLEALANNLFGVAALEKYQSNLAIRGGIPWGVLTAPGNLKQAQAQALRDNFVNARMSAMGAPATLSGGVTLTPFNLSPRDMALLELRQFDEARIVTLLGVPPHLMGLPTGESMTYKNAEGIYDFHWRAYLKPKAATIAEAISNWALPSTQSIEFNRDDYVKPPLDMRTTAYQTLFNIFDPQTGQRAITVDEIRQAERLAALDSTPPDMPPDALSQASGQSQAPVPVPALAPPAPAPT